MKKLFFGVLAGIVAMGAGCVESDGRNVEPVGTVTDPSRSGTEQSATTSINTSAFSLDLSSGETYETRDTGGRYQNFVAQDGPQTLGEGEYFVEFGIDTYSDLEFNSDFENVTSLVLGANSLDRGTLKSEYYGGDTTKYIVGYFRSGDASHKSVVIRVYADTQSGIAAGEATLKNIQWK